MASKVLRLCASVCANVDAAFGQTPGLLSLISSNLPLAGDIDCHFSLSGTGSDKWQQGQVGFHDLAHSTWEWRSRHGQA